MKGILSKLSTIFLVVPVVTFAGWQVATPENAIPPEPFFQAAYQPRTAFSSYGCRAFPNRSGFTGKPIAVYAISISGSLKENIERIMDRYHWKVVWKADCDYNFDGRVTGTSLPNVIQQVLNPFPLQAVLYMSNRVMLVIPRYT